MGDLSLHFSRSEFRCRCGCGADAVSPDLVETLEVMRAALNNRQTVHVPIGLTIVSGCRCPAHNAAEGGKAGSAHLTDLAAKEYCEAADLAAPTSRDRYLLVQAALDAEIKRIGIGKTFVHVDVSPTLDQEVLWLY
jgi:hypothetical protein